MRYEASIRRVVVTAACVALIAGGCGDDADEDTAGRDGAAQDDAAGSGPQFGGHESEIYADDANWLCRPGLAESVCEQDLDATAVFADGTTELQPHEPAEDPAVDCFYVYPTVSFDEGPNSDLEVDDAEEVFVTLNQAARLTASCRVFAPVYRQATLGMIGSRDDPPGGVDPWEAAYEDVNDAFRHYIDNDSEGRGFVLIGHSQGAGHLRQLIIDEIDGSPELRDRMVSALLIGSTVAVPEDDVVGADFANVPGCETPEQTGCVVSYASFRADEPPPENSFFGRPQEGDGRALCVNPASLDGSASPLQPYFQVEIPEGSLGSSADPFADETRTDEITTPFVTFPDFVEAACEQDDEFSYLALTVNADPGDERTEDIGGDLSPEWGMHLIDVNVAMGDLVDLVATQADAYDG